MKTREEERQVLTLTTEVAIRLALLAALVFACFQILSAFAMPVIWAILIAIAVWPLFRRLTGILGGRQRLAAVLFTLLSLALLLVPSWLLAESVTHALVSAGKGLASGTVTIPPPPEHVTNWPLVGEELESVWTKAAENPSAAVKSFLPQIKAAGHALLAAVGGIAIGVLQFAFSLILAGVFLATAKGGSHAADAMSARLAGAERGRELVKTAADTVSSVVKGVLGVAGVQAVAATLGLFLAGVPASPAWGLLVFFLAVVQLPPILVMGPMIFHVFATTPTFGAVLFMIWAIVVSVSDTFLKPLFLGRGVAVPMLVILIGAIGGMIAWGVLGLFVGAVVLAVGYQLFRAWFANPEFAPQPADESG